MKSFKSFKQWLIPLSDSFSEWRLRDKELRNALYILYLLSQSGIDFDDIF